MSKIDLSPQALQERRMQAEKEYEMKRTVISWAINSNAVLAMINEIERLRSENEILFSKMVELENSVCQTDYLTEKDRNRRLANSNLELREQLTRLEAEANWLAEQCKYLCDTFGDCESCILFENAECGQANNNSWRNAAREAIANQCKE